MGERTEIAWTHATFNPWWGCVRVSPGCENCYAESSAKRWGHAIWGPASTTPRRFFGKKHWDEPLKWDRAAAAAGERRRVFCASMADVFENNGTLNAERWRLWSLIRATPNLDWLLLTKRPENLLGMLPWTIGAADETCERDVCKAAILDGVCCPPDSCDIADRQRANVPWPNVWIGVTAEDQARADQRIPILAAVPAVVRFVSAEPLLGPLVLRRWLEIGRRPNGSWERSGFLPEIDWVIIGGESGHSARPFNIEWARDIVKECQVAGVAPFVKQLGDVAMQEEPSGGSRLIRIKDMGSNGGAFPRFPADLQVREFPIPRAA